MGMTPVLPSMRVTGPAGSSRAHAISVRRPTNIHMNGPSDRIIGRLPGRTLICLLPLAAVPVRAGDTPTPHHIEHKTTAQSDFLLALPPEYKPGDQPALVVCLHGTNTNANDILSFWLTMNSPYPMLFVATQSSGRGWRDTDAARVFAAVEYLRQHHSADWTRVLLTGHSAGGAMTFHLIYERKFPAAAAATTANYLPPSVTGPMIRARSDLPVYYAVGMRDINQERMRAGITLLRSNGTSVVVRQPDIGHILDRDATQQALDFFVKQNSLKIRDTIRQANTHFTEGRPALAVSLLQPILDNTRYHITEDVADVETAMSRIEQPGKSRLARAESLIADRQYQPALDILCSIERDYTGGRLARKSAELRKAVISQQPQTPVQTPQKRDREKEAGNLLDTALELTRQRKFKQAKDKCRILLANYQGTRSAAGAKRLLEQLELHTGR